MTRKAIPIWCFSLVVVRRDDHFLLVQERKHGRTWYLPAGRVEPGESFLEAARRETLEESGVPVRLEGMLRLEHTPAADGTARLRVFFLATPLDDTPPKQTEDEHSVRAEWVRLEALDHYTLRSREVRAALERVARGGPVYPLELLGAEGEAWQGLELEEGP